MDRVTDIFDKNLRALEEKNPALAERLRSVDKPGVEIERTRSGDYTFRYRGRYFHSRYDPWKEAGIQAEEILSKKPDWVILFGLGCGYLLRTLVREGLEKLIVYEPSIEILMGVLANIDLSGTLSNETVLLCQDTENLVKILQEHTDGMYDLLGYQSAPYKAVFPDELREYHDLVRNVHIASMVGIKTDIDSRLKWIENYFANLRAFSEYPPVDVLKERFDGVPMVIVGAGPSLRKNAHLLKEVKGKALIIAAVTAYRPLLKAGVVPDLVISAEKHDLTKNAYFTDGEEDRYIRLVLADVAHPNMLAKESRGKFIFFSPFVNLSAGLSRLWGSEYTPSIGGSVTTAALDMGVAFGCNPIVFIGQDLCFSEGRTHAVGSVYTKEDVTLDAVNGKVTVVIDEHMRDNGAGPVKERFQVDIQWLKGVDGKPVPSKFDWVIFHQWLEKYASELKKSRPSIKVINATEGGAYIEGMEHMSLGEAIGKHFAVASSERSVEEVLSEAETERKPVDYGGLLDAFTEMKARLEDVERISTLIVKEASKIRKRYVKTGISPELKKNVDRIGRLEGELFDRTSKVTFMWEALVAYTYELKTYLRKEQDESLCEQFRMDLDTLVTSYTKVKETAERFVPILERAIITIEEEMCSKGGADGQGQNMAADPAANIS